MAQQQASRRCEGNETKHAETSAVNLVVEISAGSANGRWAGLFADERCSESILEFLRTTDVGRKVPAGKAEVESTESGAEKECPRGRGASASAGYRAGSTCFT